jgi:UDP-N-acetylglucosamine transferase subunit ALG13
MTPSVPLVFVTVGTDHHPFDRLISWVDGWLAVGDRRRARCVVQCGTSRPPSVAEWTDYLAFEELQSMIGRAAAVVTHGGPATIMECRRQGIIPLVVPREARLGEHVDDHQTRFAWRVAEQGGIRLVADRGTLWRLLDEGLADGGAFRGPPGVIRVQETVERFSRLVDALVERS